MRAAWHAARFSPPQSWKKGLLIGANHIGDILYRTCVLEALRTRLPGCTWDILAPAPADQVAAHNPWIRHIHRFCSPRSRHDPGWATLYAENYDVAICYDTGAYAKDLKLAVHLGIPNRVGYIHKGLSGWVTHPIPIHYPQPFPGYFKDLVDHLTGTVSPAALRPKIFLQPQDHEEADAFWVNHRLNPQRPVIAVFATSRQPFGLMPESFYSDCLRGLCQVPGVQLVLLGAGNERMALEQIRNRAGVECVMAVGELSLRGLVAFLQRCTAALSSDSGPRHLANAAGIPVVFSHNHYFHAVEAGPYCDTDDDLRTGDTEPTSQQALDCLLGILRKNTRTGESGL